MSAVLLGGVVFLLGDDLPAAGVLIELSGLLWLAASLAVVGLGAAVAVCTLRLRSPVEFVLAAYLVAWGWVVAVAFLLSPVGLLTRAGLSVSLGVGLLAALLGWHARGRPRPPSLRPVLREVRIALRRPEILVLALAVVLGAAYSVALAFLTPVNEGDALSYHLARAAFWRQEHGLGYVDGAVDIRLNGNPPNAEIGQLVTMLLSGSDRYVALPQLAAYGALALCVGAVARRIGFSPPEALFGALAFATLPVVAVQASGALNDLVVASFLAIAVLFALRTGWVSDVLLALGVGLALGTKLTAVLALPTLALVVALARPRREWLRLGLAGLGGVALGSAWYVVNLVETGQLDGGLAESSDQKIDLSAAPLITNALRFGLDLVDLSGAPTPYATLYLAVASALGALGLWRLRSSASQGAGLIAAAGLTALPYVAEHPVGVLQDAIVRVWAALGRPETAPFELGWNLNVEADPVLSWFGPAGVLLLAGGTVTIVVFRFRRRLPTAALGLALAPWALLLSLMATITWDPFRGRFLVVGIALAAATWGVLLRFRVVAAATAAIGATTLVLALANYLGKPSGLDAAWSRTESPPASLDSIWGDDRAGAQARLRLGESEREVFRYIERNVPANAHLGVAARENELLSPYFGARLSRTVELIHPQGGSVSAEAEWLLLSPGSSVDRCREAWRRELLLEPGWRLERRTESDRCRDAGGASE